MKPLEGYTVIDLTTFVAAPFCARLLSDLGARVIKIETVKGDGWRGTGISMGSHRFSDTENPIFDLYNSGKDLISLNLKTEEGMAIMHQLLSKADVFITNNRPAALSRLGLGYDDLKVKYPKLVYGIVLGYGEEGPDADMQAYDTTAFWTRSGFLRDCSPLTEDYLPINAPSSVGDSYTGTNLAMQVMAALLARQQTGRGQYVSSSLYHIGIFAMGTMTVRTQRPFGIQLPQAAWELRPTAGAFKCADGEWIFLSTGPRTLCEAAGRPELMDDPMWLPENLPNTKKQRYETLRDLFLTKTSDEWMELLTPLDTPTIKMPHFADVNEDPQAWANRYLEKVTYPTGYTHSLPTSPIKMECFDEPIVTQVTRCVGQDTTAVLKELGYSDEQIQKMNDEGIIVSG